MAGRPRKSVPSQQPKFALRDEEIQALAEMAVKAWESGVEHATTDRVGGVWSFLPERHETSGLRLARTDSQGENVQYVGGAEMGIEAVTVMLASRILAIAAPAIDRVNSQTPAEL